MAMIELVDFNSSEVNTSTSKDAKSKTRRSRRGGSGKGGAPTSVPQVLVPEPTPVVVVEDAPVKVEDVVAPIVVAPIVVEDVVEEVVVPVEDVAAAAPVMDATMIAPAYTDDADDFGRLYGVGPTYAERLHENGIHTFAQLASLGAEEVAQLETAMNAGSIEEQRWVWQAGILAQMKATGQELPHEFDFDADYAK